MPDFKYVNKAYKYILSNTYLRPSPRQTKLRVRWFGDLWRKGINYWAGRWEILENGLIFRIGELLHNQPYVCWKQNETKVHWHNKNQIGKFPTFHIWDISTPMWRDINLACTRDQSECQRSDSKSRLYVACLITVSLHLSVILVSFLSGCRYQYLVTLFI